MSAPSAHYDTAPPLPPLRWWMGTAVGYALVAGMLFLPALRSYFSCDDFLHLGTVIQGSLPFAPTGSGRGFLRPLVGLSFLVEHRLWGIHPFGYHVSNVLLHGANSVLVTCLSLLLLPPGPPHRATSRLAGLSFLILACHAESVSWISGRTDLIATFFSLLTLCAVVGGLRQRRPWMLIVGGACFVLALFSKESALALPFVVVVTAGYLWQEGTATPSRRYVISSAVATMAILAGYFVLRYWQLGAFIAGYGAQGHLRFHQDLLAQAAARFMWRVYLPPLPVEMAGHLSPFASRLGDLFTVALILQGLVWAFLAWKRPAWRKYFFCYVAFWLALLPVINVRVQWTNVEGERFLYLPSIFAALGAAWILGGLTRPLIRRILIGAFILFQCVTLWNSNYRWYQAAEVAEEITRGIQRYGHEKPLVLVNKPDSLDGALIFRTGLTDAVQYFGDTPCGECEVEVLFATTLYRKEHHVELTSASGTSGIFTLKAVDKHSVMVEEDNKDRIETLSGDDFQSTFRFREPVVDRQILLYTPEGVDAAP